MFKKYLSVPVALFAFLGFYPYYSWAQSGSAKAVPKLILALDYAPLPSDAGLHHRTKWSNDVFLYIDDDAGAPQVYVFDRSGKLKLSAMIQIPYVNSIRLDDYAATPDGGVWAAGHAISRSGQWSNFLARIAPDRADVHMVQTGLYDPTQLTVAPDGTVWTAGYAVIPDGKGGNERDWRQDTLRHFDPSGKMIGSAMPSSSVGWLRPRTGFLAVNQDHLGWYSPPYGAGAYVEFSLDMKVLRSYPVAHTTERSSRTEGFVLTPSGRVFVMVGHSTPEGRRSLGLYELDRAANEWVPVDVPRDGQGNIPWLEGDDGESLVFSTEYSKLQFFDVSQAVSQR